MKKSFYKSWSDFSAMSRRTFLRTSSALGTGLVLGTPTLWAREQIQNPERPRTNLEDALSIPKTEFSLPGKFAGKVVSIKNEKALQEDKFNKKIIQEMIFAGIEKLTGKNIVDSFRLFFNEKDVVGIKVNPVGAGLISTRLEVVSAIIKWLVKNGIPKKNIIIWDRFDYMLTEAGFIPENFPGLGIEGLQTMDEEAALGKTSDNSRWLRKNGKHVSFDNFDQNVYYWVDVEGPKDLAYLNQHVVNGKYSYFGKLLSQKLTKIINIPVFKNTGNGISMATKNLGYGSICNTNRLHRPLFFDVCTEVLAFPVIRDKLVLNITDGLRAQYDGGPMPNAKFTYPLNTLFFATDPFALDMYCHNLLVKKRKEMGIKVNEHPRFTEYLRYAEQLGLGITSSDKMNIIAANS